MGDENIIAFIIDARSRVENTRPEWQSDNFGKEIKN